LQAQQTLFAEHRWQKFQVLDTDRQQRMLQELVRLGLPDVWVEEWLINYLAPFLGADHGFPLWLSRSVVRHYGLERSLQRRLGLAAVRRIFEQQALLHWQQRFCLPRHCSACPLLRSL
jgi:hypothetical protein